MTYSTTTPLDRSKPPKPGLPSKVTFPKYFEGRCDNGFRYFVVENHTLPIVTIGFVAKEGALFDGDLPGLGSVTSELLTKGTKNRTATQIAEEIDFVGGSLSTNVSWDASQAFVSVLKHHLATGFNILQDIILNPVFPESEIARVKAQRLASIQQLKAEPGYLADVRFLSSVFGGHPYGQPSSGTEKSIAKMTRRDFVKFHKTHCTPGSSFLVFAGDIDPREAEKYVSRRFARWRGKMYAPSAIRAASKKEKGKICIVDKPGAVQSALRVGHIGIARNSRDFLKAFVMNTLLGGYFSSRINMNLREVHGYTYGGKSTFDARMLPGVFEVATDVRNDVTSETVNEILIELNKIRDTLPSKDEMTMVKNYLAGLFPIQLETPQQVAGRVIVIELYNLPKNYYRNYRDDIMKVTARDIQAVAKKYIHPDRLSIVLSGSSKEIAGKLKKFGEVAVLDPEGNKISEL